MPQKPASADGGGAARLFFGSGTAAGIQPASCGFGALQDSAALIATVFRSALMAGPLPEMAVLALRRLVWPRLVWQRLV